MLTGNVKKYVFLVDFVRNMILVDFISFTVTVTYQFFLFYILKHYIAMFNKRKVSETSIIATFISMESP